MKFLARGNKAALASAGLQFVPRSPGPTGQEVPGLSQLVSLDRLRAEMESVDLNSQLPHPASVS